MTRNPVRTLVEGSKSRRRAPSCAPTKDLDRRVPEGPRPDAVRKPRRSHPLHGVAGHHELTKTRGGEQSRSGHGHSDR